MRAFALAAAVTCSCRGGGGRSFHAAPSALWSYDPSAYFSDRDFVEASAFSTDLAVLTKLPWPGAASIGVVALDAKTGVQRWHVDETGWLLHPPHATDPLYLAPRAPGVGYDEVDRLDPRTGKVLATIPVHAPDYDVRFVWSPHGVLVISGGSVEAYDLTTGSHLWAAQLDHDAYLFPPTLFGDRAVFPGKTNRVIALADGRELAAIPGQCCRAVASPDGRHLFVGAESGSAELDDQLHVVRRVPGEVVAASNTHYVVELADPTAGRSPTASVFAYGATEPLLVLRPENKDDYFTALELSGPDMFYFHAADAKFVERDLRTGRIDSIADVRGHFVVSTEVVGSSPAILSTPPVIERPLLFTEEWGVHAYRIGDD